MSLARPPEAARTAAREGEGSPVSPGVSDAMRLARILCILLLVYAHAQPYQPGLPESLFSPMGLIHYLRQLLGHTSVPLLSLISGYLLARALSQRPYAQALSHRFVSLIVPLVLWNLIYLAKEYLESGFTAVPEAQEWPNAVLALTAQPAMAPLYFLRDAFVCALISPAFVYLARRWPRTAAAALLLNALLGLDGVLFLNGAIPLFYFAGCLWWVHQAPIPTQAMPREPVLAAGLAMALLAAAPFLLPAAWGASDPLSVPYAALDIALRAAGCVVFWALASRLLHTRTGEVLLRFEPIAFFIFCTHGMATGLWWMAIERTGHAGAAPVFLAHFALSPLLALLVCVPAVWALRRLAPRALSVLMGGRSPSRQQMARMTRPLAPAPLARPPGLTP
ncbi:MAG: acyltransferase family protein [Hydrogenophaga sp.]|uniref:acyltransferase family protein n=1 Tax=Hydrogenophaga sp. TaxID=1904254 RepID=UPI0016A952C7|nr:acyltransferase [Hydrogenophaga sp.]NIN24965.1 acyltransferase family protein [Hydrogenophaga sp.]NIQ44891.1 acyltransferase family protein [Hydrogenophaga sp.]